MYNEVWEYELWLWLMIKTKTSVFSSPLHPGNRFSISVSRLEFESVQERILIPSWYAEKVRYLFIFCKKLNWQRLHSQRVHPSAVAQVRLLRGGPSTPPRCMGPSRWNIRTWKEAGGSEEDNQRPIEAHVPITNLAAMPSRRRLCLPFKGTEGQGCEPTGRSRLVPLRKYTTEPAAICLKESSQKPQGEVSLLVGWKV